jgi:hypothetical protein
MAVSKLKKIIKREGRGERNRACGERAIVCHR